MQSKATGRNASGMARIDWFLDTSVLLPAFDESHVHNVPSAALLLSCQPDRAACATYSLVEFASVASRLPAPRRLEPSAIVLMLGDIQERLSVVAMSAHEHSAALQGWLEQGIGGGALYDAMLANCALKAGAREILAWNTRHFARLGPEVAKRLRQP